MVMAADKKSSLVQIAQATLDEAGQSVKVVFTVNGEPISDTNPMPVNIDEQNIVVDVALDRTNDSVTAWQGGTWNITDITGTISLPTGAATSANQTNGTQRSKITDGTNDAALKASAPAGTEQALVVRNIPSGTQTVSGTVTANAGTGSFTVAQATAANLNATVTGTVAATQSGTWTVVGISGSVSLPTGASTEAKQDSTITELQTIKGSVQRLNSVTLCRNAYGTTSVTTGVYVQLIASMPAAVKEVEIFDSSGETLVLAIGGAGSEVDKVYVFPGGNGRIPLQIAASARLSIKAVSANATSGEFTANFYG